VGAVKKIIVDPFRRPASSQEIAVDRYTRIRFVLDDKWEQYIDVGFDEHGRGLEIMGGAPFQLEANASNVFYVKVRER
jgi:hypothetical protein